MTKTPPATPKHTRRKFKCGHRLRERYHRRKMIIRLLVKPLKTSKL